MKTEFIDGNFEIFEEEKKELTKFYNDNNYDLLQCRSTSNFDTIFQDKNDNNLYFSTETFNGKNYVEIGTNQLSNETIMNIIRILLNILQKRMQNKKKRGKRL